MPSTICPFLGNLYDPETALAFPSPENRCYKSGKPLGISSAHQGKFCLSTSYVRCPIFANQSEQLQPSKPVSSAEKQIPQFPEQPAVPSRQPVGKPADTAQDSPPPSPEALQPPQPSLSERSAPSTGAPAPASIDQPPSSAAQAKPAPLEPQILRQEYAQPESPPLKPEAGKKEPAKPSVELPAQPSVGERISQPPGQSASQPEAHAAVQDLPPEKWPTLYSIQPQGRPSTRQQPSAARKTALIVFLVAIWLGVLALLVWGITLVWPLLPPLLVSRATPTATSEQVLYITLPPSREATSRMELTSTPPFTATAPAKKTQKPNPTQTVQKANKTATTTKLALPAATCGRPANWVAYIVQAGDTLSRLSQTLGVTIQQLQAANCMGSSTTIYTGSILYVPFLPPTRTPTRAQTATSQPAQPTVTRTIRPSETPSPTEAVATETQTETIVPSNTPLPSDTPAPP